MWSHFQLSAVWVIIQLVSAVSATTTSTCNAVIVRFKQPRKSNGDVLCVATSPPDEVLTKNKMECSRECAARGAMCAGGFHYKHQQELCELFISPPTTSILQVQDGCEYYSVIGTDDGVIQSTSVPGYTDENLALNKPASQINTYLLAVASRAVDGRQDTGSCTDSAVHPWLSVDLGAAYDVGRVTLTHDDNQNGGDRLDNFVIGLTNDNPATVAPVFKTSYTVCAQYSGSVAPSDNVTVICSPSYEKFRFVVVHSSFSSVTALCLTEVFVYARNYTVLGYIDENVASNKPASQVSTSVNQVASLAVDGRLDTVSCTGSAVHPWLAVDLGAAYYVGHVTVTNDIGAAVGVTDAACNPTPQGFLYVGHKSVTVNGRTCQAWASQSPHVHRYNQDSMYADGSRAAAVNYCRNPDVGWTAGLFCYTTDPSVPWEPCSVRDCAYRLDNFVIGLTNDDPATTAPVFKTSYTVCAQYNGFLAAHDQATVICSPSYEKFRYVIVHGSFNSTELLCLKEVVIYARFFSTPKPILIQQHVDDSSFFDRSWNEFRTGFGDPSGNFWLGNEQIHQLSKDGRCKLRFDVQQKNMTAWFWAEYSTFIVADETNNYQLTVAGFSGNVNYDAFGLHNHNVFATSDRDVAANCAQSFGGGFWYNNCGYARVNAAGHLFDWDQLSGGDTLMYSKMWLECP